MRFAPKFVEAQRTLETHGHSVVLPRDTALMLSNPDLPDDLEGKRSTGLGLARGVLREG